MSLHLQSAAMLGIVAVWSPLAAAQSASAQRLHPDVACRATATDPVTYEVDFSAVVTAPYQTKILKVWMPIPPSNNVQQVARRKLTSFPEQVQPRIAAESVYGNTFAYFEFHNPQGAQIIRHQFTATVSNLNWNLDPNRVEAAAKWPDEFQPYLRSEPIAESDGFQQVIHQINPLRAASVGGLFQAMNWIDRNLAYSHDQASLQADSRHAFTRRVGHCSDYHGLCAAMGRSLGFPTRVTYGLSLFPKNSPSHCKLEAFLPPYGWVSFDLSETQKMIRAIGAEESFTPETRSNLSAAARSRLLAGFRENSWLLMTRGTDYHLAPAAANPVKVVRTIYAEADGKALPEPDPANREKREFSWMTAHRFTSGKPVIHPFKDYSTLKP